MLMYDEISGIRFTSNKEALDEASKKLTEIFNKTGRITSHDIACYVLGIEDEDGIPIEPVYVNYEDLIEEIAPDVKDIETDPEVINEIENKDIWDRELKDDEVIFLEPVLLRYFIINRHFLFRAFNYYNEHIRACDSLPVSDYLYRLAIEAPDFVKGAKFKRTSEAPLDCYMALAIHEVINGKSIYSVDFDNVVEEIEDDEHRMDAVAN